MTSTVTGQVEVTGVVKTGTGRGSVETEGFTNIGPGVLRIAMADGGPDLVLRPGECSGPLAIGKDGRLGRVRCNECGIATGEHHTWCPLWRPYEAT